MPFGSSRCSASSSRSSRASARSCSRQAASGRRRSPPACRCAILRRASAPAFAHVGEVRISTERLPAARRRFRRSRRRSGRGRSPAARTPAVLRCRCRRTCSGWRPDGVEQLGQRDGVRAQAIGVGDHLELPFGAADRRDLRHAGTASRRRRTTVSAMVRSVRADRRGRTKSRRTGFRP